MFAGFRNKVKVFLLRNASSNKMVDIIEVRAKNIGLTQVTTETDIRLRNSFFLPVTIISIRADLLNRDGMKVGRMIYEHPQKIKGNSDAILTTISKISIITSLFHAVSSLLSQPVLMKSVGVARVKFLWWIFEIPVNDTFEVHPSKIKMVKDETEDERELRKQKRAESKEDALKRKHKENYIPKEGRMKQKDEQANLVENITVLLDEPAVLQMAKEDTIHISLDDVNENDFAENNEIKPAIDSDNI